jgi:hypothetical protein
MTGTPILTFLTIVNTIVMNIGTITAITATNIGTIITTNITTITITVKGASSNQRRRVARHAASYLRFK